MLCPIGHNKLRLCLKRGVIKAVVSWEFRRVSWEFAGCPRNSPGVLGIRRVSWEFAGASCDITAEKKSPFFLVTSECTSAEVLL